MTTDTTSHVEKKLEITINYACRQHPFHPEPAETVLAPEALRLRQAPVSDCARYDRLLRTG